jgi:outer membrane protein assembly factor BamC
MKTEYLLTRIVLFWSLLSVGGCGYLFGDKGVFRDGSEDYKKAPETARLQIPQGKDESALQDIYNVPKIQESLVFSGEFEVPRPTPLVAGASDEIVRIQRLGEESWAVVSMAPGQLWPQVRGFMTAAGMQVARIDARAGLMESGWLTLESAPMASRFQFRIEQGVQRGSSELHVLQMNQAGDIDNWPLVSDSLEQEAEMLQGVAQYVANSSDSAPVSMVADQAMGATGKISLQEASDGHTFIRVGLPYQRAWASLAKALEASTFEINDRDRSKGEYYVTFKGADDEEEEGWFDWLYEDDEHPLAGQTFLVNIVSESDRSVAISMVKLSGEEPLELRQEQALLSTVKSNIN